MALSSSLAAQSSSHYRHHVFQPKRCFLSIDSAKQTHHIALSLHSSTPISKKALRLSSVCFSKDNNKSKADIQPKETGLDWPILKRWDVPWGWQTVCLTLLLSGLSYILAGHTLSVALHKLGICLEELSLDKQAEITFLSQGLSTAVALGVVYGIATSFDHFLKTFFAMIGGNPLVDRKDGYCGQGLAFLTGVLGRLLPLVGSSSTSTAHLVGITSVFAPLLEETLFRGFLMVSLTKWVPTPVAVIISAAVFALAHRSLEVMISQDSRDYTNLHRDFH
uniref:CAAX prenyl protease 2/Lysostaphin resistance protein A-like domain-containing protein n=1 Tax=Quercus lobata TaxID=97700 RepID=A0A7N2L966_QUELO